MTEQDGVRIISVSIVTPPLDPAYDLSPVKLCFFDVRWLLNFPVQSVLFYDIDVSLFSSVVEKLKQSLSHALKHFQPLARKLVYSESSEELELDCTDAGIVFYEAESNYDMKQLAGNGVHDVPAFTSLVPDFKTTELPAPLVSIQVTRFTGGGMAVGWAMNHVAVDGAGTWLFLRSWAKMCRTGVTVGPVVSWDRAPFRDSLGLEISKFCLKDRLTYLSKVMSPFGPHPTPLMRQTFFLAPSKIHLLKERAMQGKPDGAIPVSTFVAVAAHAWICKSRAKSVRDDEDAYLLYVADCRKYFSDRLPEEYFGNCIRPCMVTAKASQLNGEDGFHFAIRLIQESIHESLKDPLKDFKTWPKPFPKHPNLWMNVAATPRFNSYDMDFGWGRPCRVEIVSMNCEGYLGFTDAKDGGVQVCVALAPHDMVKFASFFLDGLDGRIYLPSNM